MNFFQKIKKKLEIIPKKIVKDTKIIFCTQSKTNNKKKIVNYLKNNSINFSIIQGLKFELIQKKV